MAATFTKLSTTVFGNLRVVLYDVTNYTNNGTLTVHDLDNVKLVIPMVNVASASVGYTVSGNTITFKTAADTYDGQMFVIGQ